MKVTAESLRRDLADGAGAMAGADRSEAAIRDAATKRHGEVLDRLGELRATALTVPADGDEYQALTLERGKLDTLLGHG